MQKTIKRTLSLLLCVAFVLGTAACGNPLKEAMNINSDSSSSSSSSSSKLVLSNVKSSSEESESEEELLDSDASSSSSSTKSYQATVKDVQSRMLSQTIKYYELNNDTVGWLYIPGTTVDESVVRNPADDYTNEYYLRRTNLGVESTGKYSEGWYGCYYTDYRTILGNRLNLSKNTVIYGHSMTDNADGVRFSQLNNFRDIDFCKEHPYIYFSTIESEMVWQVFAVFYTNVSFKYNTPNPSGEMFYQIINEAQDRSFFDFEATPSVTDKILTLSTCTYNVVDYYPNDYRMVVMAKLLDANTVLQDTQRVTVNIDKLGPDDPAPTYLLNTTVDQ